MDKVRYGLIGLGNIGFTHANYFKNNEVENAELTAICDINPKKLEIAKERYPQCARFDNHMDMIKSGLVDAVIIAVPHYYHPPIGIDALRNGIHVLSEKPAGVYTKQVQELIDVANETGLTYAIMFQMRTSPMYQKMREMVQGGELGKIYRCIWIATDWFRTQSYYDSGDWRATWGGEGGGVLLNQCPHTLDLWQWICGVPKRIRAFCTEAKYHNIEVEDDVTAYAEYEDGSTGVFITTTGEAPGTNRLEVTGTKGKLIAEGNKITFIKNLVDAHEYNMTSPEGFSKPKTEKIEYVFDKGGRMHPGITQNVTNHILNGEPLLAYGYEGINGLSISNAIMLSSWKNDWVEVKNDGEEFWAELQKKIATSKFTKKAVEEDAKIVDMSESFH